MSPRCQTAQVIWFCTFAHADGDAEAEAGAVLLPTTVIIFVTWSCGSNGCEKTRLSFDQLCCAEQA